MERTTHSSPPPPPPPPFAVLRGHTQGVSVVRFLQQTAGPQRLVSGDVSGACCMWDVAARRTVATFQACGERQSVLEVCAPCTVTCDTLVT